MKTDSEPKKLASFWISPLVAGICLATGYETTQRVMIVNGTPKEPTIELFQTPKPLPETAVKDLSQFNTNTAARSPSNVIDGQAKEMDFMLDALEISWIDSTTTKQKRSSNQIKNKKFSISKETRQLRQQTFDKLFQSLPAP